MHFITRATPIYYIDGKGYNLRLKNGRNYLTSHTKSKSRHYVIYGLCIGHTDSHADVPHKSDFRKPGAC